jgi:hypothetical protein
MYTSAGGRVLGPAAIGGAGVAATDAEAGAAGLARTGGPLLVLTTLAVALVIVGFLLVRARLRATEARS